MFYYMFGSYMGFIVNKWGVGVSSLNYSEVEYRALHYSGQIIAQMFGRLAEAYIGPWFLIVQLHINPSHLSLSEGYP